MVVSIYFSNIKQFVFQFKVFWVSDSATATTRKKGGALWSLLWVISLSRLFNLFKNLNFKAVQNGFLWRRKEKMIILRLNKAVHWVQRRDCLVCERKTEKGIYILNCGAFLG